MTVDSNFLTVYTYRYSLTVRQYLCQLLDAMEDLRKADEKQLDLIKLDNKKQRARVLLPEASKLDGLQTPRSMR